jgi:hypothetical protein
MLFRPTSNEEALPLSGNLLLFGWLVGIFGIGIEEESIYSASYGSEIDR